MCAGVQGPRPVRLAGAGGGRPRRGEDGHRDPELHHQGRVRQRDLPPVPRQGADRRRQEGRRDRRGSGETSVSQKGARKNVGLA